MIEPFCGSAALTLAALHEGTVASVILGDINAPLMDLWDHIILAPENLAEEYKYLWERQQDNPKEFFLQVRESFNRDPRPAYLLYLLNRIVKGSVRYNREGQFNQAADNRRLGAKPLVVRTRLLETSALLGDSKTYVGSYEDLCLVASPKDVIYLDPPYQGTSRQRDSRYVQGLAREDFEQVLATLVERELSFVVSYDEVREDERYGQALSSSLHLGHLHVSGGPSTQGTLLGRSQTTRESLYVSPALLARLPASTRHRFSLNTQ